MCINVCKYVCGCVLKVYEVSAYMNVSICVCTRAINVCVCLYNTYALSMDGI